MHLLERGEQGLHAPRREVQGRQREPRSQHDHHKLPAELGRLLAQGLHLAQRDGVHRVLGPVCGTGCGAGCQTPARTCTSAIMRGVQVQACGGGCTAKPTQAQSMVQGLPVHVRAHVPVHEVQHTIIQMTGMLGNVQRLPQRV